ncbi:tRNA (adenosine(37)-N6)-dimethylallyltransferase MiaA [Echinicola jeungdonensis]|uniref:tRNA dimethylallyltransferase n=1 Tax=Echinicola jeungdonensis TaxID=709343 RepID=A0ABV5J456_9BACT|nr:tRNA (adenosine(37)-N6)-dimethylallyltransferase MiaA [Echinicola jeungdonensis]MDN3670081.1 tRNA (adenosine(37)-N6)-dimethylallyltransferase MiaA [Echinicola jeungdonensis]
MVQKNKYLLVIAGPTAVGKTALCINLAKKFNTVIISSDSRQFFREMELGTAKPSQEELGLVPHYFINQLSIHDHYDVRDFEKEALHLLDQLFQEHDLIIMTGGSGLYFDAVCEGFDDIPSIDPEIRKYLNQLYEEMGIEAIQKKLSQLDPDYYAQVDKNNPQRLIRGCEVTMGTGKPFSIYRKKKKANRPFKIIKVGLERDRAELYERINWRMEEMIKAGLFEEAERLFPFKHLNALQTVGYSEIFGYLEGNYDREEAIRLLKRNSRRYAKRQMTWFRRDENMHWFHPQQIDQIASFVEDQMEV